MESGPTEFRLVCSAAVGKSESTISHLESQTGAKIRVLDDPSCEDCIIVVTLDPATNKDHYNVNREGEDESWTPEQRSLVRVYERIVKGEAGEKDEQVEDLTCRMIIGRGVGKVVEKIESESGGGAQVRVLAKDQIPGSGAGSDELIQITGSFPAVKKALLSVSSCVQDSPRVDVANTNVTKPPGMLHHGNPMSASVEPFHQRGYAPSFHSRGYSSGPGPETVGAHNRIYFEEDVVFKLLCHLDKVGSLIGKGGSIVRTFQNETGASIKIADVVPDSDERVVLISAREAWELNCITLFIGLVFGELGRYCTIALIWWFVDYFWWNSEQRHSPAQDAVMRVHSRIAEIGFEPGNAVVARLLVHSQQIGCLLGRGGYIISEMRRATGASIRVFPREQAPKCGSPNDEVVQVIGNFHSVQDALFHITSRLRETIFPMKPHFPNNGPPYLPPFPEMPPPPFRPRHNPASPGSYPSPVGPFHGIDRSQPIDRQPAFSHGMDHMGPPNFDRVPYPYGGERPGHGHIFDRPPSPRSWGPQVDVLNWV
ncbi:hypothetical protein Patl1_34922 [Pistacia atlantica]|uniref:Uncharacterized protein n=1 Tax=Pistacia atlantica TaxID=434234 RepID=A0ACC0ZR60_9ROSI|nr:hypothetical protein Patl1_34922 [Pistacia atlantica]